MNTVRLVVRMSAAVAVATACSFDLPASGLPVSRAALARSGLERHPAKLVVTPLFRNGKAYDRVEFSAGARSLVVNGDIGQSPWNHFAHFGTLSLIDRGKETAELHLLAHDEWNTKAETPGQKLVVDREKGTATWSRPYTLSDGTEKTLSYVVSTLPDGRVAVDYDFGLTLEEAKREGKLPISCRLNLAAREDGTVEYGFGGKVHEMCSADELIAEGARQRNWGYGKIKSAVFDYEARDAVKHWSLTFPRESLMKAYGWVEHPGNVRDGKRYRGNMIHGGQAIGDFRNESYGNDVKGRFVWDLGATEMPVVAPEPPVGGIDFWGYDALHVPAPVTRNLVMNGSFEQDFKGWRWEDWGAFYTPSDVPREEIVAGGRFGAHALLLRGVQHRCPAICSAPMPLEKDARYTVSCWAKSADGQERGIDFRVRSVANSGKYWQFRGQSDFPGQRVKGTGWQRLSFTFTADAGGFVVQLSPGWNAGREGVLVDAVQVEKGDAPTDYVEAPFVANLLTSNPYNDLRPGEPIAAKLDVQSVIGGKGGVWVRIYNGYYEKLYDKRFPLELAPGGRVGIPLAPDPAKLGKGVFVVRMDFARKDGAVTRWTDYTRFSIQEPLANKHPTAQMYANHAWYQRVSRAPHYMRKFVEWGWGSTDGNGNEAIVTAPWVPQARALGIRNYVHPITYEGLEMKAAVTNRPSGSTAPYEGPRKFTGKPEELELVEVAAYQVAKKADPKDDIFTFWNEEEDWSRRQGFETHWQFVDAVRRGATRAWKERGLGTPRFSETHGTSHYFNGRNYDAIEGYLKTALDHGFRYDVVTIHPYQNIDASTLGPKDADIETQHLIDTMKKYGYPDSTPIMFTECFNMLPWRFPSWGSDGWGDSYRSNTTPSHDCGNREFVMAAAQMRLYILALKFWPKVQLVHPWNHEPINDLRFTPLLFTFSANTLGHLLPNPTFVGDAQPYGDVRGYCFRQDGRAVMPVWTTNHDVENGEKKSPVLEMTLPADTTFVDMFGNARKPTKKQLLPSTSTSAIACRVPLTPAPLFLISKDAEGLLKGLREAVADDPSTALLADLRPDLTGVLNLTLENLTKAPRKGIVKVGEKEVAYDLAPRGKGTYPVLTGMTAPMTANSWKGHVSPLFPKPWSTRWFYVPKCGHKPDWSKIPALPLATVQGSVSPGFKASCQYAWNKDFLFIRVEAEDPTFQPADLDSKDFSPKALYNHDGCLEVYFDGFADGRSQGTKGYDLNDSRYDFLQDRVHRFLAVNWQLAQGTASATDEEIKEKLVRRFTRTAKGYVYELAFAARYMAPVDLKPGTVAGTGICLHDYSPGNDGRRRHASVSDATQPGEACDQKPWVWPLMVLTDKAE